MDHRMITIASPSMREYRGDVSKIDLQAYKDVENIAFYQVPSNFGSGFSMENETSLRVHICTDHNDVNFLDMFLHHLVEYKEEYKYVKNLLFHGIEWQSDGVQLLCSLLVPGSSVKQLEFQKNVFSTKSAFALLPLSEMLQRTNTIKSVVFSGCRIGSTGAKLLASALAKNRSVEEFQVWEDSIGSKGAEELSKMIEVNYLLKKLVVLDKSLIAAAPLISAVVARNRRVEVHIWGSIRDIHSSNSCKIVEFLPETGRMRIYSNINSKGLQRIACALAWNTTVTTLDMSSIPLKSRWTKELRGVLERNRSLRAIKLTKCSLRDKAVVYIAAGLFKNTHLESLSVNGNRFGGVGLEHLLCPISTFSPVQRQANTTLKILSFGGEGTNIGRYGITAILQMLETNQSLIQLTICNDASLKPNDVVKIFTSLERNATLRSLSLRGCKGVEGEIVLQTIMGTLEVNPWIEEVDLHETPLYLAGKTDQIYEKLCQNGSLDPPTDFLDLPLTAPTSCRVFLFGQELAGKNALHKSIYECMNPIKPPHVDIITTLKTPVEQKGTNEDKINVIFDGNTKLTLCNIGEQEESFALHDFMFLVHGGPRFFMILSSLVVKPANRYPKSIDHIEQDLMYWLKFLVSNARRVSQLFLPCVTIVLTHYDKVAHLQEGLQPVAALVQRLREEFHSYAEIYPTVFAVDARSSVSVSTLTHHLRMTTKTIVQQAPQINEVCNDMVQILHDWRLKNNKAVIRWSEYREICQLNIPTLRLRSRRDNVEKVDARRHAVAKSLHNMGEIIFFEELQVLIMDCDWFCRDILSQLGTLKSMKKERSGFVSKQDLEKILQEKICNQIQGSNWRTGVSNTSLQGSDVINMLLKLELCYELDPGNPNTSLLVPAILEESKEGTQRWQLTMPECRYIGRCLECKDTHMFLTSDFFPRLQVRLHNKIMCLGLPQGTVYNLEKNLIYTVISGVHVRVELSMKLDSSINVLACSSRSVTDMVRLLHKLIIPNILNLSSSMMFEESVIRSECVKYLIPHRFLQTQRLPLKRVKQILLTLPAESIYDYEHTWSAIESNNRILLQSGSDHARDILSDDDFHEVLHRRYYDLQHLATELAVSPDSQQQYELIPEKDVVDPSILGIAKGVEMVLQRLKRVEQGIRDLKEEISSLRFYEYHMVVELHRKMDYVMNYNIQLEERKVPQLFYFVNLDNRSKHLVTRILPGMRSLRVHMLCEFRREMHVVDDQIGCDLVQVDNQAVKSLLPYMSKFMKLLTFALKIGAHFIVGMGEMIPDLSREVVHLLDSSVMYGTAASAASVGVLGAAALYGKAMNSSSNQSGASDMGEDMKAARQWLVDFLKGQGILTGMDIAQRFGLWRVRYRDDGHIAWICRKHIAAREEEIFELPL